jgi:hypothetical protein
VVISDSGFNSLMLKAYRKRKNNSPPAEGCPKGGVVLKSSQSNNHANQGEDYFRMLLRFAPQNEESLS